MRARLIIYLLSLIGASVGATLLLVYGKYYIAAVALVLVVIFLIVLIREYRSNTSKLSYMLNALENNDSSYRFRDKGGDAYNTLFINTLNRINDMLASEKMHVREQEKYFELMLQNVITGIITMNDKGEIIHCNEKALHFLGLIVFTHIAQIKKIDESLYEAFLEEESDEGKIVSLFNESGKLQLSLKFSHINLRDQHLKIVAINDIGRELEEKEMESWTRLIRVLTHEIMNNVTPISSMSDTMLMMINEAEKSGKNRDKIKIDEISHGLNVISQTSKGLISFVESYRRLSRLPEPNRKPIYVKDLIHRVLTLSKDDMERCNINPLVEYSDNEIMIYADENLVSQVIVNIINNGLASMSEGMGDKKGWLSLKTYIDKPSEDVIIEISNNGLPISVEDQEHIFVPFFTTKTTGTGIGLSISRQIMRQHNGVLKLKVSNENETTFSLIFK